MASNQSTVDFIVEQISGAGTVSARKMFGEYGLYCDGKIVALICGDQLFIKLTAAGRAFAGDLPEAPPYPGAKPSLLVNGDLWDDGVWLTELVRRTAADLPLPVKKPRKKAK